MFRKEDLVLNWMRMINNWKGVVSWIDPEQNGYFARDKQFVAEFQISGRNYSYGKIRYIFMDGRRNLSVQDEVLLERVHDAFVIVSEQVTEI